jgi:hypothetical protein
VIGLAACGVARGSRKRLVFFQGGTPMQMVPGLVVCLAALAPVQRDDITTMDKHSFRIPIFVDPARAKEIDWLYLHVSSDKGKTWKKAQGVSPDKEFFAFSAPKDGLYWFAVQIVSKDLRLFPPTTRDMLPDQKVLVSVAARVPPRLDKDDIEVIEKEVSELKGRLKELEKRLEALKRRQRSPR